MANKGNKKDKKSKKEKYPDSEMKPYNPFAVCTDSVGRDDKEKYESCIQQVKQQNKERNMKDKKDKKSSVDLEDKLMSKVAGLMDDAGVFTGGQKPLPTEDMAILRNASLPYKQQLENFLGALLDLPINQNPGLEVQISKIQSTISRAMELAGI